MGTSLMQRLMALRWFDLMLFGVYFSINFWSLENGKRQI
jgi:hypothetical protein